MCFEYCAGTKWSLLRVSILKTVSVYIWRFFPILGNYEVPSNTALVQSHFADRKSKKSYKQKILYFMLTLNS